MDLFLSDVGDDFTDNTTTNATLSVAITNIKTVIRTFLDVGVSIFEGLPEEKIQNDEIAFTAKGQIIVNFSSLRAFIFVTQDPVQARYKISDCLV